MGNIFQNVSLKRLILAIVLVLSTVILGTTIGFFSINIKTKVVDNSKEMADSYTLGMPLLSKVCLTRQWPLPVQ